MNPILNWLSDTELGLEIMLFLMVAKLTLLLSIAWLVHLAVAALHPGWRVLVWRLASIGSLLIVALTMLPPVILWRVVPAPASDLVSSRTVASILLDTPTGTREEVVPNTDATTGAAAASQASPVITSERVPPLVHNSFDGTSSAAPPVSTMPKLVDQGAAAERGVSPTPSPTDPVASTVVWILGIWLTGFMVVLGRSIFGFWRLRCARRRAKAVPKQTETALESVARDLGLKKPPIARQSVDVASPCLVGLLRPVILLPADMINRISHADTTAILAHECAHLRGGDVWWNSILHCMSMLLWFHPLAWRVRLAHVDACDRVADAIAARYFGSTASYCRVLATLALQMSAFKSGASLAMVRSSIVCDRIEMLHRNLQHRRLSRVVVASALVICVMLSGMLGSVSLGRVAASEETPSDGTPAINDSIEQPTQMFPRASSTLDTDPAEDSATRQDDVQQPVQKWIEQLSSRDFSKTQEAKRALALIGEPAVAPLVKLALQDQTSASGHAIQCLAKLGPVARPAIPALIQIMRDRDWQPTVAWTWNATKRQMAFSAAGEIDWAAGELLPVLLEIATEPGEALDDRTRAIHAMRSMGSAALEPLHALAGDDRQEVRYAAVTALSGVAETTQGTKTADFIADWIRSNPIGPETPRLLMHTKGRVNLGRIDPLTQEVKTRLRELLQTDPDAESAWALAVIINSQLSSTALSWKAPIVDVGIGEVWDREDTNASFHTLIEALDIGLQQADRDSELFEKLAIAMAKTKLLMGDWDGMNEAVGLLGQNPVPTERLPYLSAPPSEWRTGLADQWEIADEALRSGDCGFELTVERNGSGVAGAHVLIRELPERPTVFRTGVRVDTILHSPRPISFDGDWHLNWTFGYGGSDRARTRYAVTDDSGIARFDGLPEMDIQVEVLIPTGNFVEAAAGWTLWMQTSPTESKMATPGGPDSVSSRAPPATVTLRSGTTTRYPKLIVRPKYGLNVHAWSAVDPDSFQLEWDADRGLGDVEYRVDLAVSAPSQYSGMLEHLPRLASGTMTTKETQLAIAEKGVGNLRLRPGNVYLVSVTAVDKQGIGRAQWGPIPVWTPYDYRESEAPTRAHGAFEGSPIYHQMWNRGSVSIHGGREATLRQWTDEYLAQSTDAFEHEYVRVGKAWFDWHDGDAAGAAEQLRRLMSELPPGNVARETAAAMAVLIDTGQEPPKRLHFTAGYY